jgi:ApbE superfamily uncharacterized protein (UPF0280 family)
MIDHLHERTYRQLVDGHLPSVRVTVQETDLIVYARHINTDAVRDAVIEQRGHIEGYLRRHPGFYPALEPWPDDPVAPPIVREMIRAGQKAAVGPMAAVAGAMAEAVGRKLLDRTDEIIIENGGDIFLATEHDVTVGVYAGNSPLSLNIGLNIPSSETPFSICTSSGTVGHSTSFGKADAVCVLCRSCAQADAGATAIGNQVRSPDDIEAAIRLGRTIPGIVGILVIVEDKMGAWGRIEISSPSKMLRGKNSDKLKKKKKYNKLVG